MGYARKMQERKHQTTTTKCIQVIHTHIEYYDRMCTVKTHANKHHNGICSERTKELKKKEKVKRIRQHPIWSCSVP